MLKEIKLSPNISKHDVSYRIVQANKFLAKGLQVRVTLVFKGRERVHEDIGFKTIYEFVSNCQGKTAGPYKVTEGRRKTISVVLNPVKK